jgi:hypothetical protein
MPSGTPGGEVSAREEALEKAAAFALAALNTEYRPDLHRIVGERCGEDVCWLCAAEERLRAALSSSEGREDGGR